jgi:hypothetical protein
VAGEECDGSLGGDEDCYSGEDLGELVIGILTPFVSIDELGAMSALRSERNRCTNHWAHYISGGLLRMYLGSRIRVNGYCDLQPPFETTQNQDLHHRTYTSLFKKESKKNLHPTWLTKIHIWYNCSLIFLATVYGGTGIKLAANPEPSRK